MCEQQSMNTADFKRWMEDTINDFTDYMEENMRDNPEEFDGCHRQSLRNWLIQFKSYIAPCEDEYE